MHDLAHLDHRRALADETGNRVGVAKGVGDGIGAAAIIGALGGAGGEPGQRGEKVQLGRGEATGPRAVVHVDVAEDALGPGERHGHGRLHALAHDGLGRLGGRHVDEDALPALDHPVEDGAADGHVGGLAPDEPAAGGAVRVDDADDGPLAAELGDHGVEEADQELVGVVVGRQQAPELVEEPEEARLRPGRDDAQPVVVQRQRDAAVDRQVGLPVDDEHVADLDEVAVCQQALPGLGAVHDEAVGRADVADDEGGAGGGEARVPPRRVAVAENQIVLRVTPDGEVGVQCHRHGDPPRFPHEEVGHGRSLSHQQRSAKTPGHGQRRAWA